MKAAGRVPAPQHVTLTDVESNKAETKEKKSSGVTALHRSVKVDDPDIDMLSASMERSDVSFTSASEMSRNLADCRVDVISSSKRKRTLGHVSSDNQHEPSAKFVRRISSDEIDLESIEANGTASANKQTAVKANVVQPIPIRANAIPKEAARADTIEQTKSD
ncbi:hypothetical protein GCM10023116_49740 [Kistimonas scapharcae]|uniref:Uncharacterized protein n=1 Tax=Kistimonas scapharcae TaxID=1036133 RepID=A0ABP8VBT1_9GAMM